MSGDELEARRQDVMRALNEPAIFATNWDETLQVARDVRFRGETANDWHDTAMGYRQQRDTLATAIEALKGSNKAVEDPVRELLSLRSLHTALLKSYNEKDKALIEAEHKLIAATREWVNHE